MVVLDVPNAGVQGAVFDHQLVCSEIDGGVTHSARFCFSQEEQLSTDAAAFHRRPDGNVIDVEPLFSDLEHDSSNDTAIDEREFTRELYRHTNVTVLPGSYLSRPGIAGDPGLQRVRIALVAGIEPCVEAARRIRGFVASL